MENRLFSCECGSTAFTAISRGYVEWEVGRVWADEDGLPEWSHDDFPDIDSQAFTIEEEGIYCDNCNAKVN